MKFKGGRRQIFVAFGFWGILFTQVGPGEGCLIKGVYDSSLTLLPLSSLTCNKKGSLSFLSSHFSSLYIWVVCFTTLIFIVMSLVVNVLLIACLDNLVNYVTFKCKLFDF